jgi:hypothetical protein
VTSVDAPALARQRRDSVDAPAFSTDEQFESNRITTLTRAGRSTGASDLDDSSAVAVSGPLAGSEEFSANLSRARRVPKILSHSHYQASRRPQRRQFGNQVRGIAQIAKGSGLTRPCTGSRTIRPTPRLLIGVVSVKMLQALLAGRCALPFLCLLAIRTFRLRMVPRAIRRWCYPAGKMPQE